MGTQRVLFGRIVVMKPYRKHGNGAVGSGRKQSTGKRGSVYQEDDKGEWFLIASAEGGTGREAQRKLRADGYIPAWVAVNNNGETHF